jgi:phosphatidate cytidylyltransferase
MLVSWFAVLWLTPNGNSMNGLGATALPAAALGSICTVAGLLGDLSESMIKRIAGAKDSGAILPGLGGFWDVTDSLLATAIPGTFWFASWANQS